MVQAIAAFLEACYIARQTIISEVDVLKLEEAARRFRELQNIFDDVRPDGYNLPRQHSLMHYSHLIWQFGAPTSLCTSITESKHIDAVKKPYQCSNHNEALGQMLLTNQHMDKLAAARIDFLKCGMIKPLLGGEWEVGQVPEDMWGAFDNGDLDSDDEEGEGELGEVTLAKCHSE